MVCHKKCQKVKVPHIKGEKGHKRIATKSKLVINILRNMSCLAKRDPSLDVLQSAEVNYSIASIYDIQRWENSVLMTKYEYEYYSVSQKWPNTNIIWFPKNYRIRILFGFPKMTEYEYEYHLAFQKGPNANIIQFFPIWPNTIIIPKNT